MKRGDELICKKDFHCIDKPSFRCKKGDYVWVGDIANDGNGFQIIKSDNMKTWTVETLSPMKRKECAEVWKYFKNLNRIRKVAKQFVG